MDVPTVIFHGVLKELRAPKPSRLLTSYGIPQASKRFAKHLATPLMHLFNISLMFAEVRTVRTCKNAFVTPIPKTCGASNISGFRTTNMLPTLLKTMEGIVKDSLLQWITTIKCIPLKQHGFLPRASTCIQLVDCTNYWIQSVNTGKEVLSFTLISARRSIE